MGPSTSISLLRRLVTLDLDDLSDRELIAAGIGLLLLLSALAWTGLNMLQPPAQARVAISGGPDSGAYHLRAQRIAAALAREGVTANVTGSQGSVENLARLKDTGPLHAEAAFVQGGIIDFAKTPELESVARLGYEGVWIFHASGRTWPTLAALRGRRVSIGAAGSGTQPVARAMLQAVDLHAGNTSLFDYNNEEALAALKAGRIDAFFTVAAPTAPFIQRAIAEGAQVLDISQAFAFAAQLPWLTPLILPRGSLSLAKDLPRADKRIMAVQTELVVRARLHPGTKALLRQVALEDLRSQGPSPLLHAATMQPADPAAGTTDDSPFLQRYLPYWWAQLLHRLSLSVFPVMLLVVSSVRALIEFRNRRTHRKILRLFAQAKEIQLRMARDAQADPNSQHRELQAMEQQLQDLSHHIQAEFMVDYYRLRSIVAGLKMKNPPPAPEPANEPRLHANGKVPAVG